jgi:hypothetical protein
MHTTAMAPAAPDSAAGRSPVRSAGTRPTDGKGEGDHVNVSLERDTPPRGSARGP